MAHSSEVRRIFLGCLAATLMAPALSSPRQQIQPPPAFRSAPTTVRARENASAVLPCQVDNLGANTVRWVRGDAVVVQRMAVELSPRRSSVLSRALMHVDNALEVQDLQGADAGEYECQVVLPSPLDPIRQTHAIEVLYPASVSLEPADEVVTVQQGDQVDIVCSASGVPAPVIAWTAMGGALSEDELRVLRRQPHLQFIANTRQRAGVYRCEASNGVGPAAAANLLLVVQHSPEVTNSKSWVHTSPGLRAELSCTIIAEPHAKVTWYRVDKDDTLTEVTPSSRVTRFSNGPLHSLLLKNVRVQDLGSYHCHADNELGNQSATILLSGAPNSPVIKSDPNMATENSYDLIWEVDSYSPIFEYVLQFKKYGGVEWRNLTIPAGAASSGALTSHSFSLRGLESAAQYEASLTARNRFGWSESSAPFVFSTLGPGETPVRIVELENLEEDQIERKKTVAPSLVENTTRKPASKPKQHRNAAGHFETSIFLVVSLIILNLINIYKH